MDVKKTIVVTALLLVGCSESYPSKDVKENSELSGKELYLKRCASCHGTDGKLGASGAKDLSISRMNSEEIREIILKGKNGMPPFGHAIHSERQLDELEEFINKLNK